MQKTKVQWNSAHNLWLLSLSVFELMNRQVDLWAKRKCSFRKKICSNMSSINYYSIGSIILIRNQRAETRTCCGDRHGCHLSLASSSSRQYELPACIFVYVCVCLELKVSMSVHIWVCVLAFLQSTCVWLWSDIYHPGTLKVPPQMLESCDSSLMWGMRTTTY